MTIGKKLSAFSYQRQLLGAKTPDRFRFKFILVILRNVFVAL